MFTCLRRIAIQKPCLIRFISTDSTHQNSSVISYLINSCGLSPQNALSTSQKLHFDSPTNPDSVLTLLRDNGFSNSQISKIIFGFPRLLVSSVDKTLKPKFDFFNSKGFSGEGLAKVVSREPRVLVSSLEKRIIPSFNFLKSIVGTDAKVVATLKRSMTAILARKQIASNIALLRTHGVPDENIVKLLVSQPMVIFRSTSRFNETVEEIKKLEFDPKRYKFIAAVHALNSMSISSLEAKFDVYKSWGWSEHEVKCAFLKKPGCMTLSEENIRSTMDYIVNKFGYDTSSVAEQPSVLLFSCEKRIIPRCATIQILIKNGKVKQALTLHSFLHLSEDVFLKRYIRRFEKEVPELLRTYRGKGLMND